MKHRLVAVVCAVLLVGCSTGSPASTPGQRNFVVGGDRPVTVHVPASYDAGHPAPLLIVLHGYTGSGSSQNSYFHLGAAAERHGMITAYPDGTKDDSGDRFWNATDACCNFDGSGVDDSKYLAAVVAAIKAHIGVDPKRVYFMGHSNGGFMSYRMACDHADVIAAIVSLAAATFAKVADCHPTAPVSVLEIHGLADNVIDFGGGSVSDSATGSSMPAYPGAQKTAQTWAQYDGCDRAATESPKHVDVDADSGTADDPAETSIQTWTGCRNGATVELWTMPGSGHVPRISTAFPDATLDFLLAHPKV